MLPVRLNYDLTDLAMEILLFRTSTAAVAAAASIEPELPSLSSHRSDGTAPASRPVSQRPRFIVHPVPFFNRI